MVLRRDRNEAGTCCRAGGRRGYLTAGPASYIAALGGKLELVADIGGHLLKMPDNPAA